MPTTQNTSEQTYEQSVKMFEAIRDSSLTFADSVVAAFAQGGASAEARWKSVEIGVMEIGVRFQFVQP